MFFCLIIFHSYRFNFGIVGTQNVFTIIKDKIMLTDSISVGIPPSIFLWYVCQSVWNNESPCVHFVILIGIHQHSHRLIDCRI